MSTANSKVAALHTRALNKGRLFEAAYSGDFARFKRILKNFEDGTDLATTLLSIKDEEDRTVLHLAAVGENTDICKYLVNQVKLDVNIRDGRGFTPLHCAVATQKLSTARFLIAAGADVNDSKLAGMTPLHLATVGNAKIIELLITKGANINSMDGTNATPLGLAASDGNKEAVEVLLKHNANPNLCGGHKYTPVLSSILARSLECLELLLKAGGDPNINPGGVEPLFYAIELKELRMLECLVKYGADPNVTGSHILCWTPLELAASINDLDAMKILFPVTARIQSYPDWSIHGILEHIHSGKREKDLPPQSFLTCKDKGNEAFKEKKYETAVNWYTKAIFMNPLEWTSFSNRSLCRLLLGNGEDALADAMECINLNPSCPKAHYRKGGAYKLLKDYTKATEAFEMALQLDPNNKQIEKELRELQKKMACQE